VVAVHVWLQELVQPLSGAQQWVAPLQLTTVRRLKVTSMAGS
jgi:hypothetical protein